MKHVTIVAGLTVAAASALLLTGCHATMIGATGAGSGATHPASAPATPSTAPATAAPAADPTPSSPTAAKAPTSSQSTSTSAKSSSSPSTRTGRPPQPAAPTTSSNAVPGLTAAIAKASHTGLGVCGGDYSSLVAASGDLRGIGSTQYLVDTTCAGATGSSPDEVAIYQSVSGTMTRTAVLYQPTAGAPVLSAYPYLDGAHTVVLTYAYGAEYRLDGIGASSITVGSLQKS